MTRTCLLVEDNLDFAECFSGALKAEGFDVTQAHDGAQGITELSRRAFDLVITDLHMPEFTGAAMITQGLEKNLLGSTPIIFMSADKHALDKVRFCRTLLKPFELDAFKALLDTIFGRMRNG